MLLSFSIYSSLLDQTEFKQYLSVTGLIKIKENYAGILQFQRICVTKWRKFPQHEVLLG